MKNEGEKTSSLTKESETSERHPVRYRGSYSLKEAKAIQKILKEDGFITPSQVIRSLTITHPRFKEAYFDIGGRTIQFQ